MGVFLGSLLAVVGAIFAAMMTVSETVAAANLQSYWTALGLPLRAGVMLGVAASIAGIILVVISWRIRYRAKVTGLEEPVEGGAGIRIGKSEGGVIRGNKIGGFRTGIAVGEERDTEIAGNTIKGPGPEKKGD